MRWQEHDHHFYTDVPEISEPYNIPDDSDDEILCLCLGRGKVIKETESPRLPHLNILDLKQKEFVLSRLAKQALDKRKLNWKGAGRGRLLEQYTKNTALLGGLKKKKKPTTQFPTLYRAADTSSPAQQTPKQSSTSDTVDKDNLADKPRDSLVKELLERLDQTARAVSPPVDQINSSETKSCAPPEAGADSSNHVSSTAAHDSTRSNDMNPHNSNSSVFHSSLPSLHAFGSMNYNNAFLQRNPPMNYLFPPPSIPNMAPQRGTGISYPPPSSFPHLTTGSGIRNQNSLYLPFVTYIPVPYYPNIDPSHSAAFFPSLLLQPHND